MWNEQCTQDVIYFFAKESEIKVFILQVCSLEFADVLSGISVSENIRGDGPLLAMLKDTMLELKIKDEEKEGWGFHGGTRVPVDWLMLPI